MDVLHLEAFVVEVMMRRQWLLPSESQVPLKLLFKCFFLWYRSPYSSFSSYSPKLTLTTDVITTDWYSEFLISVHYSFHNNLLSFYYVLDTWGSEVNRINHGYCLHEIYNLVNGKD